MAVTAASALVQPGLSGSRTPAVQPPGLDLQHLRRASRHDRRGLACPARGGDDVLAVGRASGNNQRLAVEIDTVDPARPAPPAKARMATTPEVEHDLAGQALILAFQADD